MKQYITELDGEYYIVRDPIHATRTGQDQVTGPFTSYSEAMEG